MDELTLTADQEAALKAMSEGWCFITGGAGVGKSFVIKQYCENNTDKNIMLCAPTGVAAINIGGQTIHRLFGLKVKQDIYSKIDVDNQRKYFKNYTHKSEEWINPLFYCDVLILDEISMCRGDVFEMVIATIEGISENEEFGNKQIRLIVVGDFFQLPPILSTDQRIALEGSDKKISEKERYSEEYGNNSGFAFLSEGWKYKIKKHELTTVIRQQDKDFADALSKLRVGDIAGYDWIKKNANPDVQDDAIWICGTNKDAETRNKAALDKIDSRLYKSIMSYNIVRPDLITQDKLEEDAKKVAKDELHIKVGCKVIALINSYDGGKLLFTNGMSGEVSDIDEKELKIKVKFSNGKIANVSKHEWEVKHYEVKKNKKVEATTIASFVQFPLALGYAVTVHKSQSKTYDKINIDSRCNWNVGQLYVAISRATSVNNVYLERNMGSPKTSGEVKAFYKRCSMRLL